MDKFGIFNFLNSFMNFYKEQSNNENQSLNLDGLLNLSNNQPNQGQQQKVTHKKAQHTPLQSSMLETMASHDKFVNRVKQNNLNKK